MNVAFDISPITKKELSAHSVRGVGSYVSLLHKNLRTYSKDDTIQFFTESKEVYEYTDLLHYPYFDLFRLQMPLLTEYKMALTIHDLIPIKFSKHFPAGIQGKLMWNLERLLTRNIDVVITDSISSKKDIEKIMKIASKKIHVVYLAASSSYKKLVEEEKKKDILEKYGISGKFFLYVGDATWNKNLPRIIDAVKKTDIPLVLVGKVFMQKKVNTNSWNHDLNYVLEKIDTASIKALGFVPEEDLNQLYNHALALVMPSLYEGFGLPILEALQAGCPVITSKNGSIPEVAGEAVLYTDAQDLESITQALVEISSNQTLRKELISKGIEQAGKFTIENTMQDTLRAYHSIYK